MHIVLDYSEARLIDSLPRILVDRSLDHSTIKTFVSQRCEGAAGISVVRREMLAFVAIQKENTSRDKKWSLNSILLIEIVVGTCKCSSWISKNFELKRFRYLSKHSSSWEECRHRPSWRDKIERKGSREKKKKKKEKKNKKNKNKNKKNKKKKKRKKKRKKKKKKKKNKKKKKKRKKKKKKKKKKRKKKRKKKKKKRRKKRKRKKKKRKKKRRYLSTAENII